MTLDDIIRSGDSEAFLAYYLQHCREDLTELRTTLAAWDAAMAGDWTLEMARERNLSLPAKPVEKDWFAACSRASHVLTLARLAAATKTELSTELVFYRFGASADTMHAIVVTKPDDWIQKWLRLLLKDPLRYWPLLRRLVRDGYCDRPDDELYDLGLIVGDGGWYDTTPLRPFLLANPDLMEVDLWRLFEVEGGGETSLANLEKFGRRAQGWKEVLKEMADDWLVSRERLLDASLSALQRDFSQFRVGWFSRFHEYMEPTAAERIARQSTYLQLLQSPIKPTVTFAMKALAAIEKEKGLEPPQFVSCVVPALLIANKSTAKLALKTLAQVVAREPEVKAAATDPLLETLAHEYPDIQADAFDLLASWYPVPSAALADQVRERGGEIAPSVRQRIDAWLQDANDDTDCEPAAGEQLEALVSDAQQLDGRLAALAGVDTCLDAIASGTIAVERAPFMGAEVPRLNPSERLVPVQTFDDLLDLIAFVIEGDCTAMDVELALDGLSRLCARVPEDFEARTKPLAKRVRQLSQRWPWEGDRIGESHVGWGALVWIAGTRPTDFSGALAEPKGMFAQRTLAIWTRLSQREARPLLSTPTHAGGWLDPCVFVQRLAAAGVPDEADADNVMALLRLAPDGRAEALRHLATLSGEYVDAARYAIGGDVAEIGAQVSWWVAAARVRAPFADDPRVDERHPDHGPDAGRAAAYGALEPGKYQTDFAFRMSPLLPAESAPFLFTVGLHHRHYDAWTQTCWPVNHESTFAGHIQDLATRIVCLEEFVDIDAKMMSLLDPDRAFRRIPSLLLMCGLNARKPAEYAMAVDICIEAIADGRLDGSEMGEAIAELMAVGFVISKRWAKSLVDVAAASNVHACVVARALQAGLRGDPAEAPKDINGILELLVELLIQTEQRVTDEAARTFLSGITGSGKAAKAAKRLLALASDPTPQMVADIMASVLSGRIERVRRWREWQRGAE